jgi:hypothetical protein
MTADSVKGEDCSLGKKLLPDPDGSLDQFWKANLCSMSISCG